MDFGILLQAIGYVAVLLFFVGLFFGWVVLVSEMIENHVLIVIISFLPILTFLIILKYHMIANS
jgi:hypothetical protein